MSITRPLVLFLKGNIDPVTFAPDPVGSPSVTLTLPTGCSEQVNLPETVGNLKKIELEEILVRGTARINSTSSTLVPSHVVLDVVHHGFHYPSLSNDPTKTDKHVILPDRVSLLKMHFQTGAHQIWEMVRTKVGEVLCDLPQGVSFNNFTLKLYSTEGQPIDTAILKMNLVFETTNRRYSKLPDMGFFD